VAPDFDPGPVAEPFRTLAADYPGAEIYPAADFRIEWGPIFHRGRLDGSARLLVLGQDPGQHESIARRILVGEAGQRVQGFLHKLGIERSYVLVNAFLYSVSSQGRGERHKEDEPIIAYRQRWLDALFEDAQIEGVVAFGRLAEDAFGRWRASATGQAFGGAVEALPHPTMPTAASEGDREREAELMREMLVKWNAALERLHAALGERDAERELTLYGDELRPEDRAPIPAFDLPAGAPPWWSSVKQWAVRRAVQAGDEREEKRATVVVRVPKDERPWEPLGEG
jgi:uracil-DNA glycosylase